MESLQNMSSSTPFSSEANISSNLNDNLDKISHLIAELREKSRQGYSLIPKLSTDLANREHALVCSLLNIIVIIYIYYLLDGSRERRENCFG